MIYSETQPSKTLTNEGIEEHMTCRDKAAICIASAKGSSIVNGVVLKLSRSKNPFSVSSAHEAVQLG
jgi:hypothetical protein